MGAGAGVTTRGDSGVTPGPPDERSLVRLPARRRGRRERTETPGRPSAGASEPVPSASREETMPLADLLS